MSAGCGPLHRLLGSGPKSRRTQPLPFSGGRHRSVIALGSADQLTQEPLIVVRVPPQLSAALRPRSLEAAVEASAIPFAAPIRLRLALACGGGTPPPVIYARALASEFTPVGIGYL